MAYHVLKLGVFGQILDPKSRWPNTGRREWLNWAGPVRRKDILKTDCPFLRRVWLENVTCLKGDSSPNTEKYTLQHYSLAGSIWPEVLCKNHSHDLGAASRTECWVSLALPISESREQGIPQKCSREWSRGCSSCCANPAQLCTPKCFVHQGTDESKTAANLSHIQEYHFRMGFHGLIP